MFQRNATVTQVASSATNVTLASESKGRQGVVIFNASSQVLYVKFGTTATTTSYTVQVAAGGYYEVPPWYINGRIDGLWASANGYAYVTEVV